MNESENTLIARANVRHLRQQLAQAEQALQAAEEQDAFNAKSELEQAQALAPLKNSHGEYNA